MNNSTPGSQSSGGTSGPASSAMGSFIKIGFLGVSIFGFLHLIGCYILSWLIGQEFTTVVYVTAASVVTGSLLVFTIAFLVALNICLTAVTGLRQGAMNLFDGVGAGMAMGSSGINSRSTSQSHNSSFSAGGVGRSHISDLGDADGPDLDQQDMKLD